MMSLSSFSVVMNALRLNLWKPKKITVTPLACEENAEVNEVTEKITDKEKEEKMNTVIKVEGMMCPHCEARVKKTCEAIEGVTLATASHTEGTVSVEMTKDVRAECVAAIISQGYEAI